MALPIGHVLIGAYLSLSPEKGKYIYIYISLRGRGLAACRQIPTTHIISTIEPLYVISFKYRLSLLEYGSCVI